MFFFCIYTYCSNTTCTANSVYFVCPRGSGCVNGTCGICTSDSDCSSQSTCSNSKCVHKSLFPLKYQTIISAIGIFGVSILGGATGLGGGSFIVPVLSLCSMFPATEAVALSQVWILCSFFAFSYYIDFIP